jgi:hypothetical protein
MGCRGDIGRPGFMMVISWSGCVFHVASALLAPQLVSTITSIGFVERFPCRSRESAPHEINGLE